MTKGKVLSSELIWFISASNRWGVGKLKAIKGRAELIIFYVYINVTVLH